MNAVVIGAGTTGYFAGRCRHLLSIHGDPLIHRTIKQVNERRGDVPVYVTVPYLGCYGPVDAIEVVGAGEEHMDKYLDCGVDAPLLVLLGDVTFTDEAMDTIFADDAPVRFYGRLRGNDVKPWGEPFAVRIDSLDLPRHLRRASHIWRRGDWELYNLWCGHEQGGNVTPSWFFVEIDDATDDFESLAQYEAWLRREGEE